MEPAKTSYLFLELAILTYLVGFSWEHIDFAGLRRSRFWRTALPLAVFWFAIDQIGIWLQLWNFPAGGTLSFRMFSLPFEEYVLFVMHTVVCFVLLRQYSTPRV